MGLATPMANTPSAQFKVQAVVGVPLFILTLFIPLDPSLNIAYTLPVNHRYVDQAHLIDRNEHQLSIEEGIHKDATCKCYSTSRLPHNKRATLY